MVFYSIVRAHVVSFYHTHIALTCINLEGHVSIVRAHVVSFYRYHTHIALTYINLEGHVQSLRVSQHERPSRFDHRP